MVPRDGSPRGGQNWKTFVENHAKEIWACDFLTQYTAFFSDVMEIEGSPIPYGGAPNANPFSERLVRSIKYECLNHFVFFGERHLRYVINEYMIHF